MNKPRTHFDLTREHLSERGHYIPPKARDAEEIARRRSLPAGTLIAEQQARGLEIAHDILASVEPGEDMLFTTRMLGMAALNSSWYMFGQDASDVMRRRLWLPKMADDDTGYRQSAAELRTTTIDSLDGAHSMAQEFATWLAERRATERRKKQLGRHLGNTSLHLAVLGDGRTVIGGDAFDVQDEVRERSLELLRFARQFGIDAQTHLSVAQLADADSPLGVHWRHEAPDGAYEAYQEALER